MSTITWKPDSDGDYGTPANWSSGTVPAGADSATIDTPDHHVVSNAAATSTVGSLTVGNDDFSMQGGSLTVTTTASFAGLLTLAGGTLSLAAGTVSRYAQTGGTLAGAGTVTITGTASLTGNAEVVMVGVGTTLFQGATTAGAGLAIEGNRILENQGTFTWAGGTIDLGGNPSGPASAGGTIRNDAGGRFVIQYDGTVSNDAGMTLFTNTGALTKIAAACGGATGTTTIRSTFTDTAAGTLGVQAGTLLLANGGSAAAGACTVAAGATLAFGGGLFTLGGGSTAGTGTFALNSGQLSLTAGATLAGGLTIASAGPLALGAAPLTVAGAYSQGGGTVSGTGLLTLSGGGAVIGNNTTAMTGAGTTLLKGTFVDSGMLSLDGGRVLENQGSFGLTRATLTLGTNPNGATVGGGGIGNDAGASFTLQAALGSQIVAGRGATAVTNAGALTVAGSAATTAITDIQALFTDTGPPRSTSRPARCNSMGAAGHFQMGTDKQGGTAITFATPHA